jgi:hypothetical protein
MRPTAPSDASEITSAAQSQEPLKRVAKLAGFFGVDESSEGAAGASGKQDGSGVGIKMGGSGVGNVVGKKGGNNAKGDTRKKSVWGFKARVGGEFEELCKLLNVVNSKDIVSSETFKTKVSST